MFIFAVPNDIKPHIRHKRQFTWPGGIIPVGPCFTNKGHFGRCTSFRQCYPYFKLPDLTTWETWVIGMYDTCSYFTASGKQVLLNLNNIDKSIVLLNNMKIMTK